MSSSTRGISTGTPVHNLNITRISDEAGNEAVEVVIFDGQASRRFRLTLDEARDLHRETGLLLQV